MHRAIRIAFFFALIYCIIYAENFSTHMDGYRVYQELNPIRTWPRNDPTLTQSTCRTPALLI